SLGKQRDAEASVQNEALKLIGNIIQDLRETSKFNDERKKELIETVKKLGDRLIRVQMEFKKATMKMIDELVNDSALDYSIACKEENIEKRKHYHERFQRLRDSSMIRSEKLAQSVQNILILIVEKDPKLSMKYKLFLTTSIITPVFGAGVIIGLTVAHLLPAVTCGFILTTGGIAGLIVCGGLIVSLTVWLVYKTIQCQRFDWRARIGDLSEEFRNILEKYFPYLVDFFYRGHEKKLTNDQLQQLLQQTLQCIKVDEDTWLHNDSLNDFRREIEETLCELEQDHSIFEESCSSVAERGGG
ncbi:unnamed protein product, partial [Rotaria sp. Silwood1]